MASALRVNEEAREGDRRQVMPTSRRALVYAAGGTTIAAAKKESRGVLKSVDDRLALFTNQERALNELWQ